VKFSIHKKKKAERQQSELELQEKDVIDTSKFSIGGWEAMMFLILSAFVISFFYLDESKFNIAVIMSVIWSCLFLYLILAAIRSKKKKQV